MRHSLNSVKGGYIGGNILLKGQSTGAYILLKGSYIEDYIGDYYRGYKGGY